MLTGLELVSKRNFHTLFIFLLKSLSPESQELPFRCSLCGENRQALPSEYLTALGWPGHPRRALTVASRCIQQLKTQTGERTPQCPPAVVSWLPVLAFPITPQTL